MKIISYTNLNRNLNRAAAANANATSGGRNPSKACTPFKPLRISQMQVHFKPNVVVAIANADASVNASAAAAAEGRGPPAVPPPVSVPEVINPAPSSRGSKENNKEAVVGEDAASAVVKDTSKESAEHLGLSMKDVRAFEHERQRTKRAEERAARRAKKGNAGFSSSRKGGDEGRAKASSFKAGGAEDVDAEYILGGVIPNTSPAAAKKLKNDVPPVLPSMKIDPKPVEISLSELMFSKSQGRTRSREGKARSQPSKTVAAGLGLGEEGFEWVPAVRAVIALDEIDFKLGNGAVAKNNVLGARDMEVDEPWECVSVDGDVETFSSATSNAGDREFSYADIVLGKAGPVSEVEDTK
ncbi:hypothetical protein CPC08DRAFT_705010 [Agrocybe pediades]|nr:hypothetical protein CPC08DRAFT_705010 [Agrocybe pediades]